MLPVNKWKRASPSNIEKQRTKSLYHLSRQINYSSRSKTLFQCTNQPRYFTLPFQRTHCTHSTEQPNDLYTTTFPSSTSYHIIFHGINHSATISSLVNGSPVLRTNRYRPSAGNRPVKRLKNAAVKVIEFQRALRRPEAVDPSCQK